VKLLPKKSSSSKRRRSKEVKEASATTSKVGGTKSKQTKRRSSRRRREINIDAWIERNIDDIVRLTGLDLLGLSRDQYIELLKDIIVQLYGSTTSYTKVDVLVRRFRRYADRINPILAVRIASMIDNLSEEQLEFVIYNIGDEVLGVASKLYSLAKKYSREDLISILRTKWSNAWIKRRTQVLPAQCPTCGFNSLMPDLTCLVCDSVISDRKLKEFIKFNERLKELISILSCDEVKDIIRRGYVLLNGLGLKAPSEGKSQVDIEVYLTSKELSFVKSVYKERCEGIT